MDLSGNRYILKAKEASNEPNNQNIIKMKSVEAFFYFKDDTILRIFSEEGIYNNRTLDMVFSKMLMLIMRVVNLLLKEQNILIQKIFYRFLKKLL